ncbi:WXG100 family type VII secretion target [Microbacterium sp. 22242]|uniref:WXG100 family type VII secretion target n=1 Tax=Microbacterium sp. 22242 TaxID=3453896 RepID=UPI003F84980D
MADTIAAEEGALKKGAQAVNTAKAGIDQQVKTVRGEIEQARSYWSGEAAGLFQGLMNTWDEKTRQLNEVLVTLEDALGGTERDQQATEEQHRSTISGLGSMMAG